MTQAIVDRPKVVNVLDLDEAMKTGQKLKYLAFVEQLPPNVPIHIVGVEIEALWLLDLLKKRGVGIHSFIADTSVKTLESIPVVSLQHALSHFSDRDVFLFSSESSENFLRQFQDYENVYSARALYHFRQRCEKDDKNNILLDDLGITYRSLSPEQAKYYGEIWRKIPRLHAHQYVRNIEKAYGRGSHFVANIGTSDGKKVDQCYPLYRDGWHGWGIDGVAEDSATGISARENLRFPNVSLTLGTYFTPENAAQLLRDNQVPYDCDMIKVDIDSYDGSVIQSLLEWGYKPRVFCIEVNACFPPPFKYCAIKSQQDLDPALLVKAGLYGCSASWAMDVFSKFGYSFARYEFGFPLLISSIRDMIFIRNDVLQNSGCQIGVSYEDGYYAEPLGWSHLRSGLRLNPRDWRHAQDPVSKVKQIRQDIEKQAADLFGATFSFTLTI